MGLKMSDTLGNNKGLRSRHKTLNCLCVVSAFLPHPLKVLGLLTHVLSEVSLLVKWTLNK